MGNNGRSNNRRFRTIPQPAKITIQPCDVVRRRTPNAVEANGTDDLFTPIQRDRENPAYEAVDACYAAFDWLNEETGHEYSAKTLQRVRRVVDAWYQHLVGRRVASMNPASGLYDEFKWEVEDSPTPSLSSNHIRKLMQASRKTREQLLVVALAGWGLRASEVAALHVSQFHRDVPETTFPSSRSRTARTGLAKCLCCLEWTCSIPGLMS